MNFIFMRLFGFSVDFLLKAVSQFMSAMMRLNITSLALEFYYKEKGNFTHNALISGAR